MQLTTLLSSVLALALTAQAYEPFPDKVIRCDTSGGSPKIKHAKAMAHKMQNVKKGTSTCVPKDIAHQDNCVKLKFDTYTARAQFCGAPRCTFDPSGPACVGAGCGFPVGLAGDAILRIVEKCGRDGRAGGVVTTNNGNTRIKLIHT
jgi:hypothetical protein